MAGAFGDNVALFRISNEDLLSSLQGSLGARGPGNVANFFKTEPWWHCPACCRSKPEIARLDKNGNLLCAIVSHHDHFAEYAAGDLEGAAWSLAELVLRRFPPTLICNDCNVVDSAAKKAIEAPGEFSFAPFEIAYFINVTRNAPHTVDRERAQTAYDCARLSVQLLREMLAETKAQQDGGPEHMSGPLNRVLTSVRARMKLGSEE